MALPTTKKNDIHSLDIGEIQLMMNEIGRDAKSAAFSLSNASEELINKILFDIADSLLQNEVSILAANQIDIEYSLNKGLNEAMIDRLRLTPDRIQSIAEAVLLVRNLEDPVGKILWSTQRPNGLNISRISVPIGVLGMIYESRPNVTIDAAALCLKSRNAVILRGGSESIHSALAFHKIISTCLENNDLPAACVSMIPVRDRAAVGAMLEADQYIDVMIPRGGKSLIERVMKNARMPVFGHLEGLCHIYVHKNVNPDLAIDVVYNAKMRRTGVCGAMETLILDQNLPPETAQMILTKLLDSGCEIVGDKLAQGLDKRIGSATPEDWCTEYLDSKLSCCFVDGVEEAVTHINSFGSGHTDSILTQDDTAANYFLKNVDSGIVMHNTSTQFADGGEFGMGAEIGIGTGKLHARGPVGLDQLCTYKYIVRGTGQIRP